MKKPGTKLIPLREAKRLLKLTKGFMEATGALLARCSEQMGKDEWTALGKCLASVWCTLGDGLIYPIGDAYPPLIAPLRLPKSPKMVRAWGPRRERPSPAPPKSRRRSR